MGLLSKTVLVVVLALFCNSFVWVVCSSVIESCLGEQMQTTCPNYQYVLDRQETHLKKLENLVEELKESLTKVQSLSSDCSKVSSKLRKVSVDVVESSDYSIKKEHGLELGINGVEEKRGEVIDQEKDFGVRKGGGVSVTKYKPAWSERFQFLSAVKLECEVTNVNVLPFEDFEGSSKYVAVGDQKGRVYVLMSSGDVLVEFQTMSNASITSMLSYMSTGRNEGILVTGHSDGSILVHKVWETNSGGVVTADDWQLLSMEHMRILSLPSGESTGTNGKSAVLILEMHQIGRMRYILGSDSRGRIRVFKENGTYHGAVSSSSRPLAFFKQRLLFLTETGAGSLDLRNMIVRESECEGLNGSSVNRYVFDVVERSKAYGFTSGGDLIHVVLLGDTQNFKCRVRTKRKSEMEGVLEAHVIKGYLLAINSEKVFVYNISSQLYIRVSGPRPIFCATLEDLVSAFSNMAAAVPIEGNNNSFITGNRDKLIVLGLGGGYVSIYRSNLPLLKSEFNTVLWSSPVLIFLLFLIIVWQFFGKKKESLTHWGLDDPITLGTNTTPAVLGSGERAFDDTSRSDVRERRDVLRGPTRRYVSPSLFRSGQSGYSDTSSAIPYRSSAVDPTFRANSELGYRAPSEPPGFHQRRDPLYAKNQKVDESIIH